MNRLAKRSVALAVAGVIGLSGCVHQIPEGAFDVSPDMMAQRQVESRKFTGISEEEILIASSNVLQDMGFNLENSEVRLGVLTANKQREATNAGEIAGAIIMAALFRVQMPTSKDQTIRVALVIKPATSDSVIGTLYSGASKAAQPAPGKTAKGKKADPTAATPESYVVRVTFQRIVRRTDNSTYAETIKDPELYQEFFDKLSKSVFIEAQKI
ncbi:MAG: hypothetical protein RIQ55_198 [Pseudomonadota bacterium]